MTRFKLNLLSYHKESGRKPKSSKLFKNHEESVVWTTVQS